MELSPEHIDRPQAFGFAVSISRSALAEPITFSRLCDGGLSEAISSGVTISTRHYPSTPESAEEELPVITPTMVLAFEGRVDNREEIAGGLGLPGLATGGDGAVLAAAYAAWGAALPAKVIGEYAYVVFDRQTRTWAAGQDSLGVRRLFYSTSGSRILITSNLRLLFQRFPEVRPPYDKEVFPEYFAGTMTPWSGRTIWRGIRELGRGKVLVQRGEEFEQQSVWQPKPESRSRFKSTEEVDEAFREHLVAAVRAALRSPGPVLCDLSGGFDSSTIFSVAALLIQAGQSRGSMIGRSVVNSRSNERSLQEAVRQHFQAESHTLDLSDYRPFQRFTDTEIPTGGFLQMGAVNRATREFAATRGVRSLLTGQAADALFHKGRAAPVYLADWFREGRLLDWSRHFSSYLSGGAFNAWQLLRDCTVGTLDLHAGRQAPVPDWLTPRFQGEVRRAKHSFLHAQTRTFRSSARERVYRWTLSFIPYPGGSIPDERLPLVYRPLVEFVLGLEWEHVVRPNDERLLMRRSLAGILPEAVRLGHCRTAFGAALHEGLRDAWPRISHLITGEQLAALGVVELKPFQAALRALRAGYEGPNAQMMRTALYLETWLGVKALSVARLG